MNAPRAQATFAPAAAFIAIALTGCGPSVTTLNHMAGAGAIHRNAPVLAHVQIDIDAPPTRVWALLVNAPAWPQWDPDITQVSITQPLSPGTRFTWSEGSSTIHSQVQLFEPEQRLGWTGTALTAKAVHQWRLTPMAGSHTLVTIDESMDGPLMATLFSSSQLADSAHNWLASLKRAAEQH
jgi:uncharacterized protein YndB with AHSA1/START domain